MALVIITQNRAIRFGEKEIIGAEYNRAVVELIQEYRNSLLLIENKIINNALSDNISTAKFISSILIKEKQLNELDEKYGELLDTKGFLEKVFRFRKIFKTYTVTKIIRSEKYNDSNFRKPSSFKCACW